MKRINEKFINVHLTRALGIFALLSVYEAYLCFDNFIRGNESIGGLALFCTIMTVMSVIMLSACRFGKKPHKFLPHAAVSLMMAVYWITFGILIYTGGTSGSSLFLLFAAAPIAFYFFNLFYGTIFCSVLFVGVGVYFCSSWHLLGYIYPYIYYQRLPVMFLIEIMVCWFAQYEAVKAEIRQQQAVEEARRANEAKTDFLANTSHEIRTPMNSIMGFCELILREKDLSPKVKGYCLDIMGAGKNLLYVINDILDVSRIEAGKITISKDEFDPSVLVRDIVNAAMAKKQDKNIEIFVKVDDDMPSLLFGDMARIFQVVMNLVTNAIKYTPDGGVYITINVDRAVSPMLIVTVRDTGIGIEKKDLEKIFKSFEQVDAKRNRSIEGAGLGLTISKKIASLMGGVITAESESGKGSEFTLTLPVQILDENPLIRKENFKGIRAGICIDIDLIHPEMRDICLEVTSSLCRALDMKKIPLPGTGAFAEETKGLTHLFVNPVIYEKYHEEFDSLPGTEIVIIADVYKRSENLFGKKTVSRPLYSYSLSDFLCNENGIAKPLSASEHRKRFTAPTARVLLVDDNDVNLMVESGLMEIYGMKIFTALSGPEALDLMNKDRFDLIFMDHMMPGMDGVEVVRRMREECEFNKDTTVVALTANAVSGAREMFLANGFQDFLPKPIDIRELDNILRKYIPLYRICETDEETSEAVEEANEELFSAEAIRLMEESGLIDHKEAEKYLIDPEIMILYADAYESKRKEIEDYYNAKDWKSYNVQVHALKSSSKMVGAVKLSNLAKQAETASGQENVAKIDKIQPLMMKQYEEVVELVGKLIRL
ncbi:MAG: response regulator [Lachnospiraceae bacterium]|nr:response regulator [Lachnospiraceae bacterium]